jgi:hypothetical protein
MCSNNQKPMAMQIMAISNTIAVWKAAIGKAYDDKSRPEGRLRQRAVRLLRATVRFR